MLLANTISLIGGFGGYRLGHVSLATELYDYCVGKVTFASLPTIDVIPKPG